MAERVCVYAVVSGATAPLRVSGLAGERLQRTRVAGIDLVIGRVPRLPRPTMPALTRYDGIVGRLMQTHGSLLPARYGTCAATFDELALNVADRRPAIRAALRLVRHRVQMTVRIFRSEPVQSAFRVRSESVQSRFRVDSESVQSAFRVDSESDRSAFGVRSGPGRSGKGTGRQYLQRRAAEFQIPGTEPLRRAVRRWVRAEHVERLDRGRLAGTLYHLIPRRSVGAYRRAVEQAALVTALTILVTGPWPPYAFAGLLPARSSQRRRARP